MCSCREAPSPVISSHISRCSRFICSGTKLASDQQLLELNPSCHIACAWGCMWLGEEEGAKQMFPSDDGRACLGYAEPSDVAGPPALHVAQKRVQFPKEGCRGRACYCKRGHLIYSLGIVSHASTYR